ncbi:hypothetical protein BerOc1_02974 [Pseudodesulfovibrio hydrargyri]|uniref:Uncharacterized protein n=1 Tax=Pseudodesulfovibrio hydrargyri TaxID=2125990 RepID=A0A1J5MWT3_9BACT|nr:hypothetical protein [Pseudodesulfovibrio hydrargyri]OIQ51029.1 hypothetical protein BerOc1_02974 [Pseudodesulfovibrio hydrargyri]
MRRIATEVITAAAVAAGLPEDAVMIEPDGDGAALPSKRVGIAFLDEQYTRTGRPIRKRATVGKESTHRTLTRERASVRLSARAAVHTDDEAWLSEFSRRFVAALPKRTVDENGNAVGVAVDRAEYGGFAAEADATGQALSKTFYLIFTGMITTENEIPLITSVTITPEYREASNEQEQD